ncbi:MAG: leucine-rich repeat domain-containing protein [Paludibacteraceae bacterium]|nr:leucine-rich repeat domain-containing protein [Paludibacteraceae bacterium]
MKKNLFVAALLLVAGLLNAQTRTEIDGVWYLLDEENKTATVTFRPNDTNADMVAEDNYTGRLNIPSIVSVYDQETYNYVDYTVTAVGDSAFAKSPYLKGVTIPATVKTLGLYLAAESYLNEWDKGIDEIIISDGNEPIEFTSRQGDTGEEFSFQEAAMTCTYLYLGRNITVKKDADWDIPIFHTWGSVEEVVFGENFTEVPLAFCPYSRNLRSIQINSSKLLEAGPRMFAFLDEDKPQPDATAITLYVPYGMKRTYSADEYWRRFTIEEMDDAQRYGIKYVPDYFHFYVDGLYYLRTSRGVSVVMPQVWYINRDGSYVSQWSSEFPYKQSEITIPESITLYLKDYTTYSLTPKDGYEKTTLTVAGIGDYCFRGARNLEQLTIPNTIAEVGMEAFEDALNLKSLDIPESVIHVGWLAFARAGFEEITLPASQSQWESDAAFQECINLRKAVFKKGTTHIQDRIFFGCEALRVVEIPDGVLEIGAGAFAGCSALRDLHLPDGLHTIRNRTFRGCPLRSLEIPATVEEIEGSALLGVPLSRLTVNPDNRTFDSRDNCNAIIRKKDNTLVSACNGSFIPESVDSIAPEAFVELEGIRSLTLPKNLKRVSNTGLMNLENLTLITSYIETPAGVLESGAIEDWYNIDLYGSITLYVPAGTKTAYQADEEWGKFKNIVEMEGENKPADVADLRPVTEDGASDFSNLEGKDLSNALIGNMYVTCDLTNGDGYNSTDKALVFNTVVDQLMLDNIAAHEGNMDVLRNNFSGIVLEIPAGKGTVTIEAKVTGKRAIAAYISGHDGLSVSEAPATKTEIDIPFDEEEKAFVYIYGIYDDGEALPAPQRVASKIQRAPAASEDDDLTAGTVNIYSAKWTISEVTAAEQTEADATTAVQKVVRDGKVFILRDGKTYNMFGAEVQ